MFREYANVHNRLEYLFLSSLFSLVLCLWVRPGGCLRVEIPKATSLGQAPALPINIKLAEHALQEQTLQLITNIRRFCLLKVI